jgi:hypothetical protein
MKTTIHKPKSLEDEYKLAEAMNFFSVDNGGAISEYIHQHLESGEIILVDTLGQAVSTNFDHTISHLNDYGINEPNGFKF